MQAAAAQWEVPAAECETGLHEVVHKPSGRRAPYGSLVPAAAMLPVPKADTLALKPRSAWRYIGKDRELYDLADIVSGKAVFGMDAKVDGMVYASIERPPVLGATLKSFDDKAALAVRGVRQVVTIDPWKPPIEFQPLGGVAVIADSTWAAMQGRKALKVEWDLGQHAAYDSARYKEELLAAVKQPGKVARSRGDVDARRIAAKGGKVVEASYYVPHHAHATMEPPVAVADFRDGTVTAWAPVQNPQAAQDTVAKALGIDKSKVICHVTLLGGGFGRKSKPDFVAEAAVLSKKVGKPVKVVWTREDDLQFDYYHAVAAVYHKARSIARGRPTAWLARSSFPPIASTFTAGERYGMDLELGMGLTDLPFDVPAYRAENCPADAHVRIGWFRSVANIYQVFAASASSTSWRTRRAAIRWSTSSISSARGACSTSRPTASRTTGTTACRPRNTRSTRGGSGTCWRWRRSGPAGASVPARRDAAWASSPRAASPATSRRSSKSRWTPRAACTSRASPRSSTRGR